MALRSCFHLLPVASAFALVSACGHASSGPPEHEFDPSVEPTLGQESPATESEPAPVTGNEAAPVTGNEAAPVAGSQPIGESAPARESSAPETTAVEGETPPFDWNAAPDPAYVPPAWEPTETFDDLVEVDETGVVHALAGSCCPSGDCICRDNPNALTARNGPYRTATLRMSTGTAFYPTNAAAPYAAVALCGGFLNSGPEMNGWGTFYASHGIVTVVTSTGVLDFPDVRARKLLASIEELKRANTSPGHQFNGKLAGRYGTSGYSMGGGGTTIASQRDAQLKTSIGLAPWAPTGLNVRVPTLLLCGNSDLIAPCSGAQGAYRAIPEATPKMGIAVNGASHLSWFGPGDAGFGTSGEHALAFQKVFLEGDERWKPLLLRPPSRGTATTNVK